MESGKETSIGRDRIGIHPGQYYDEESGNSGKFWEILGTVYMGNSNSGDSIHNY